MISVITNVLSYSAIEHSVIKISIYYDGRNFAAKRGDEFMRLMV